MKRIPEIYNIVYYFSIPPNNWKGFNSSLKIKYIIAVQIFICYLGNKYSLFNNLNMLSCIEGLLQVLISMVVNKVHLAWWPQHELLELGLCSKEQCNLSIIMDLCQRKTAGTFFSFFISYTKSLSTDVNSTLSTVCCAARFSEFSVKLLKYLHME